MVVKLDLNMTNLTFPYLAAFAVAALLATGCSSSNEGETMNDGAVTTAEQGTELETYNNTAAPVPEMADGGSTTMYTEEGGLIIADDRATRVAATTPAEERMYATNDLNSIRTPLVAELERVRNRLKDGTRAEEARKADQERAAELAQGLERVDRALVAIGESTDLTWSTVRESQLKEVEDVREWLVAYRTDRTSSEASI